MIFICSFELVDHDGDGVYVAYPAGLGGGTRMVSVDSVESRLADRRTTDRARKEGNHAH